MQKDTLKIPTTQQFAQRHAQALWHQEPSRHAARAKVLRLLQPRCFNDVTHVGEVQVSRSTPFVSGVGDSNGNQASLSRIRPGAGFRVELAHHGKGVAWVSTYS